MVRTLVALLALGLLPVPAFSAEKVANPLYASWAKHKVGTSVTYCVDLSAGGMQMSNQVTHTLTEVTPEHVVIVSKLTMEHAGQKQQIDAGQTKLPAMVEAGAENLPPEMEGEGEGRVVGRATLELAGSQFDCEVVEFKGTNANNPASGTMHRCVDIPGGLVKLEAIGKGEIGENKMTITAVSYEVK